MSPGTRRMLFLAVIDTATASTRFPAGLARMLASAAANADSASPPHRTHPSLEHQATLLSFDQRATPTYEAVGAVVERLAP